jgi:hypothetical protein
VYIYVWCTWWVLIHWGHMVAKKQITKLGSEVFL